MNSSPDLRKIALEIFNRTLSAIDAESVTGAYIRPDDSNLEIADETVELSQFNRIIVIAIGKAGFPMARAVEKSLGRRIQAGMVATNAVIGQAPSFLPVIIGGHPLPNAGSLEAAAKALEILHENDADDTLVIFLISGGGSALFEKPIDDDITLDDLQTINRVLVGCGAVISEMNIVRRFLSAVKGGRLAAAAPRSRQVSVYISDVNSDDLSTISSGPTLASEISRTDFERVIERYGLLDKFPHHISTLISGCGLPDLPRANGDNNELRSHHLMLDNRLALREAQRIAASDFGCVVEIADDLVEGDVDKMARAHIDRVSGLRDSYPGKLVCLLSGGEVVCPVRGGGQGGRNQEFVLRAAMMMNGVENIVALSAGTDGIDGNSPANGAIADGDTVRKGLAIGASPNIFCDNSDSFNFFEALGDTIITGPTGNNVRDIRIFIAR